MKLGKRLVGIFCLVALCISMLTVPASAKKKCDALEGNGSATTKFTVSTNSNKNLVLRLKQSKGTADYSTILSENLTFIDDPKSAKMYGGYNVTVYDSMGNIYKSETWKCSKTYDVPLGKNGTYTVEITPWAMNEVFCEYIRKWAPNFLRYNNECVDYDGTWTTPPAWSVKKEKGITDFAYAA